MHPLIPPNPKHALNEQGVTQQVQVLSNATSKMYEVGKSDPVAVFAARKPWTCLGKRRLGLLRAWTPVCWQGWWKPTWSCSTWWVPAYAHAGEEELAVCARGCIPSACALGR